MRSIPLFAALAVTLTSCSQVSYKGDLDDADVPYFFSGAMGEQKINGSEVVLGVWSSLFDTCDLATQFLSDVNGDIDDEDDVIDAMGQFAKDRLPQDWWMQIVFITASDDDDIDGLELGDDEGSIGTIVCHFTEDIDIDDDTPESFCGVNESDADIEVTEFEKDDHIVIESDVDLVRFDNSDGDTDTVGGIQGTANAGFCEGFSDAIDDFFDACQNGAERGCNPAIQKMLAVIAPVVGGNNSTPVEGEGEGEGEGGGTECFDDSDCPLGDFCDFDEGICIPDDG